MMQTEERRLGHFIAKERRDRAFGEAEVTSEHIAPRSEHGDLVRAMGIRLEII